jgi:hypothetical protein
VPALPVLSSASSGTFLAVLFSASEAPRQVATADENAAARLSEETSHASAATVPVEAPLRVRSTQEPPPSAPAAGISGVGSGLSRVETQRQAKPVTGKPIKDPPQSPSDPVTSTKVTTTPIAIPEPTPIATPAPVKAERVELAKGAAGDEGTGNYSSGSTATAASLPTAISSGQSEQGTAATPVHPSSATPGTPEQAVVSHRETDQPRTAPQTKQLEAAARPHTDTDDQTAAPSVAKDPKDITQNVPDLVPQAMLPIALALPINSSPATGLAANQPPVKATATGPSGNPQSRDVGATSTQGAGNEKTGQTGGSTADAPSSHSQNKSQSTPPTQTDATEPASPINKNTDGGPSQAQASAAQVISHQSPASPHTDEAVGTPARAVERSEMPTPKTDASEPAAPQS